MYSCIRSAARRQSVGSINKDYGTGGRKVSSLVAQRGELVLEQLSGPEDADLDRALGQLEDVGDLGVVHVLGVAQQHRLAVEGGKLREEALEDAGVEEGALGGLERWAA